MVGEQYYLFLTDKSGNVYRVYSKGISLKEMDERTTRYKDKRELVTQILSNTKLGIKHEDITDVTIARKPNKDKEEYKNERGPLYKKDRSVLNTNKIGAEFEIKAHDKKFVLQFIKSYAKIKNFTVSVALIKSMIEEDENYFEELQYLVDKVSRTYKGTRGIYFSMKDYDKSKQLKQKRTIHIEKEKYVSTEREIREGELRYLIEHDRESLDISDFVDYPDMSPFDVHKYK